MEFWEQIQPHIIEILGSLGMIAAIMLKVPGKTKEQKLKQKYDKAHRATVTAEKTLHAAYEKEAEIEKEYKNVTSK